MVFSSENKQGKNGDVGRWRKERQESFFFDSSSDWMKSVFGEFFPRKLFVWSFVYTYRDCSVMTTVTLLSAVDRRIYLYECSRRFRFSKISSVWRFDNILLRFSEQSKLWVFELLFVEWSKFLKDWPFWKVVCAFRTSRQCSLNLL